jgi:hypothetical protein
MIKTFLFQTIVKGKFTRQMFTYMDFIIGLI